MFSFHTSMCVSHLFDHVSDFPLLALEHVVQMVDFLFQNSHFPLQLLCPADPHNTVRAHYWWLDCHWVVNNNNALSVCVFADLCSPFWPSSLILRSSRSSSSRLRMVSRRVALSCSIPPSNLWSSSMRLSFLSLTSSMFFSFSSWSLRRCFSSLPSAWRKQREERGRRTWGVTLLYTPKIWIQSSKIQLSYILDRNLMYEHTCLYSIVICHIYNHLWTKHIYPPLDMVCVAHTCWA